LARPHPAAKGIEVTSAVWGSESDKVAELEDPSTGPAPSEDGAADNIRIITRLLNNFVLRFISRTAGLVDGDFMAALVLSEIVAANTAHLDRPETPKHSHTNDPPPDIERRPVSVLGVANALGIPYETTRRYVGKLVKNGQCEKVNGGVVVPTRVLQNPLLLAKYQTDNADFRRLLETVRRLEAP